MRKAPRYMKQQSSQMSSLVETAAAGIRKSLEKEMELEKRAISNAYVGSWVTIDTSCEVRRDLVLQPIKKHAVLTPLEAAKQD
jgi:hypothetical protein